MGADMHRGLLSLLLSAAYESPWRSTKVCLAGLEAAGEGAGYMLRVTDLRGGLLGPGPAAGHAAHWSARPQRGPASPARPSASGAPGRAPPRRPPLSWPPPACLPAHLPPHPCPPRAPPSAPARGPPRCLLGASATATQLCGSPSVQHLAPDPYWQSLPPQGDAPIPAISIVTTFAISSVTTFAILIATHLCCGRHPGMFEAVPNLKRTWSSWATLLSWARSRSALAGASPSLQRLRATGCSCASLSMSSRLRQPPRLVLHLRQCKRASLTPEVL